MKKLDSGEMRTRVLQWAYLMFSKCENSPDVLWLPLFLLYIRLCVADGIVRSRCMLVQCSLFACFSIRFWSQGNHCPSLSARQDMRAAWKYDGYLFPVMSVSPAPRTICLGCLWTIFWMQFAACVVGLASCHIKESGWEGNAGDEQNPRA